MGWCLQLLWWQLTEILLQLLPWQSEVLSDRVELSHPSLSLLVVVVSSLTTRGFFPLLGSKCWVVTPSVPDKSTLENLFHITRKLLTMKLLFLRDSSNNTSLIESPKQQGPQDTLIFCCSFG